VKASLRLLLVEDSEADAELLLRELRRAGYELALERVETAAAMSAALHTAEWDLIIADYSLPQFSAPAALSLVHEYGLDLPFLIVSGSIGEDTAVAAMKAGAHDFIVKGKLARLIPAIERELREASERQARRQAEQALHEREQRFRSLIENASDLIAVLDAQGTIRYESPSVERLLGYRPEELIGKRLATYVHPDDMSIVDGFMAEAEQQPRIPTAAEFRIRHRDGSWRVLSTMGNNLTDDPGVRGIVMNARDVTERKRAEEQIQRQLQRLAALHAIDMAISGSRDVRVFFSVFLEQVTLQLSVHAADILLLNPENEVLEYAAGRGFRTGAITRSRLRLGEGTAGRAAQEARLVGIPDLAQATHGFVRGPLLAGEAFVAHCVVPLVVKGQVKGVLDLFHREPLDASPEWLGFLETLAAQAAVAIDNAALFDGLQRSNAELTLAYETTLEGWSRALDLRDRETEGHSRRVTEMAVRLAQAMGMTEAELVHVRRGALLHDIGKMGIPDHILSKPSVLSEPEWETMRRHPVYAYELLAPIDFLGRAIDIPYCHHEKWDGSGYPRGLAGEEIPLAARIFAVVDVWDALRSVRPYRPGWSAARVREHIRSLAGSHFDPHVVEAFLDRGVAAAWDGNVAGTHAGR
jgi:PAS domain S-box-containing protein/putative nucleotidyltransferase with HDIG domain